MTTPGLDIVVQKKSPLLGIWYKPLSPRPSRQSSTENKPNFMNRIGLMDQDNVSLKELNQTIRKLQIWEMALRKKFSDTFNADPKLLLDNPVWVKVSIAYKYHINRKLYLSTQTCHLH